MVTVSPSTVSVAVPSCPATGGVTRAGPTRESATTKRRSGERLVMLVVLLWDRRRPNARVFGCAGVTSHGQQRGSCAAGVGRRVSGSSATPDTRHPTPYALHPTP